MGKNELTREFKGNFSELRKVINSWNLIPGSPNDEFDHLNHKILNQLFKNPEAEKINNILQSELTVYYGLFKNEFDTTSLVSEIIEWWNLKK